MGYHKQIANKLMGVLFTVAAALTVIGQSDRGAISGTVTDQAGAAVRRAKVTVVNLDSNASRETVTTEDGTFIVPELKAAPYRVTVEAQGFKTTTLDRVQVAVQITRRIDVKLAVGDVGDVTTVTANPGALQTESPVLQTNVTERQVRELPLQIGAEAAGRSPLSFIFLDSSVSSGGGMGDQSSAATSSGVVGFNFRVNGGQGLGTEILVDGAAIRRAENGTFFSEVAPGPNAYQEFTISTAQYSAEYGNSSGGVVNFTLKSGSNAFHGEVYEIARNEAFNANIDFNRLTGTKRPVDRQHDFGATIGGPIFLPRFGQGGPGIKGFRNRAFFFFNYGGYRFNQSETVNVSVPTMKMRSGDFSELLTDPYVLGFFGGPVQIYDNTVPCCNRPAIPGNRLDLYRNAVGNSIIDPIGFNIINTLFPMPTRDGVYHNYQATSSSPASTNYHVEKIDINLSEKHRLAFSSTVRKLTSIKGFPRFPEPWVASGVWRQEFHSQYYRLQEDYTIGSNLLNHFNAGFSRSFVQNRNFTRGMDPRSVLGFPANATQNLALPLIGFPLHGDSVTGVDPRAYQSGGSTFFDNQDGDNSVQLTDFVTYSRSRHTLKLGAETRWQQLNDSNHFDLGGNFNFLENQTANGDFSGRQGWPIASLITGAPEFSFATIQSIDPGFRFFEPTFFVQDDIKVTSKLTVNVGVRYDIPYPRVEARDRYRGFSPTAINPVVGRPGAIIGVAGEGGVKSKYRGLIKPDYTDFSPRLGFAYRVNDKTVVRGGYGLYYSPLLYNDFGRGGLAGYAIQGGANINFGFDANIRLSSYPALPIVDPTTQLIGADVEGFNENFKNGRTAQYSLDIQRELPGQMMLSVSYLGSKGTRLRSNFSPPNAMPLNALKLGSAFLLTPLSDVTPAQRAYAQSVGVTLPASNNAVFTGFNGTVGQALRPFPQYGRITEHMESEGQSSYNALKIELQRRLARGLQMGLSYTFSKLLTDAAEDLFGNTPLSGVIQNPYDRRSLWSPSTNVIPHSFVANFLYELPFGGNKPFLNRGKAFDKVFGGWQVTGVLRYRQGAGLVPFIAGRTRDFLDQIGFTGNLRPNLTGESFYTNNQPDGIRYTYLNAGAFSRPPDFTPLNPDGSQRFPATVIGTAEYAAYYANPLVFFGNSAPTYANLRGRPFFNEDLSVAKKTRLTERITFELRADIFNALNRGRYALPVVDLNALDFGISSRALNFFQPRVIQIVGRFIF